jgi:hypothetical protein
MRADIPKVFDISAACQCRKRSASVTNELIANLCFEVNLNEMK